MITIGIDPHKRSLTAAALDPTAGCSACSACRPTSQAVTQLLDWAQQWPERRWAVEGASGLGRGITQLLVAAGEQVLDVPAKLAARARLLSTSSARKTDLADACSVAVDWRAAAARPRAAGGAGLGQGQAGQGRR